MCETLSDHKYITFSIGENNKRTWDTRDKPGQTSARWNFRKLDRGVPCVPRLGVCGGSTGVRKKLKHEQTEMDEQSLEGSM